MLIFAQNFFYPLRSIAAKQLASATCAVVVVVVVVVVVARRDRCQEDGHEAEWQTLARFLRP